jgi:hypothetical protein
MLRWWRYRWRYRDVVVNEFEGRPHKTSLFWLSARSLDLRGFV